MSALRIVLGAGAVCLLLFFASLAGPTEAVTKPVARQLLRSYPAGIAAPAGRCSWAIERPAMAPETNTSASDALGGFLRFLHEEVYQSLGYVYSLRDGNLLGALRHGGLIPGDRDLDAVLLLPLDEGLDDVRARIAERIAARRAPFELQVNDDGKSRWLVFLQRSDDLPEPHHADIIVYPSELFAPPLSGHDGAPVYATRVQRAFSGLCHCAHWPLHSASCFESAPAYLTALYGDYRRPSGQHARGAGTLEEVYV